VLRVKSRNSFLGRKIGLSVKPNVFDAQKAGEINRAEEWVKAGLVH